MNRKPVKARKRKKCKLVGKAIKQLQSVFGCNLGVLAASLTRELARGFTSLSMSFL